MKTSKYSKRLIILVIMLNVIFAGIAMFVLWDTGSESPSLTAAWFGFTTTELLAIAGIKVTKNKQAANSVSHFTDTIAKSIDTKIDTRLRGSDDEIIISDDQC